MNTRYHHYYHRPHKITRQNGEHIYQKNNDEYAYY